MAGIDIALRVSTILDFEPATVEDLTHTGELVSAAGGRWVHHIADQRNIESTSDYWRIWYYLLEAAGLDVQLVNARDVKNVPGRPKTDKLDALRLPRGRR